MKVTPIERNMLVALEMHAHMMELIQAGVLPASYIKAGKTVANYALRTTQDAVAQELAKQEWDDSSWKNVEFSIPRQEQ